MNYRQYALPATLEEAWALNQTKANHIIGGGMWLRMRRRPFGTAIDLSALGLDHIAENENEFIIGAMVSLHDLERCASFVEYTSGAVLNALSHIVGIQFRNTATVGGSLFGRYGFSDVLTLFMALNAEVELYKAGRVKISEFAACAPDRDILTGIIVKKTPMNVAYESMRFTSTDFPILTMAVSESEGLIRACIGARPMRAVMITGTDVNEIIEKVSGSVVYGSNMRASGEYRRTIAPVLFKRCLKGIGRE